MQKEEKLKRIEEVIKVVCPELMELSFGCRYWVKTRRTEKPFMICHESDILTAKQLEIEIIGHTPRLSHVLRAIVGKEYAATNNGTFLEYCDTDRFHHHDVQWDLAKDDLSLQSPEVWNFLFNILCE